MTQTESTPETRAFCSACGTRLDAAGRFCHQCGAPVADGARRVGRTRGGIPRVVAWAVPGVALVALVVLIAAQYGARGGGPAGEAARIPLGMATAPDISTLTPQERADRLFNRVMRLDSEGHTDSVAFFATMAIGAFEALTPLTAHNHYDVGLIALAAGDVALANAHADSILAERATHLLGLVLAARVAEAQGDPATAAALRRRLVAVAPTEREAGLTEYTDHDADILLAMDLASKP
jgi:hypothetical protein